MAFPCDECDHAPFPTAAGLKMHKVRKHTKHKKGAYKRKRAKSAPVARKKYTKRASAVSLADAIAALRVRRDAMDETIIMLEVMLENG